MEIPGADAAAESALMDRADEMAKDLLADLKEKVVASARDIGTLRKELSVTVPADVIRARLTKNFDDLRGDAQLPGFRKGRAPLHLLRRKFGGEMLKELKTAVIGQSYYAAIEKEKLEVLGEPLFHVKSDGGVKLAEFAEALDKLEFDDSRDFAFTCEIETKPTFELPTLDGIAVKKPIIQLDEKNVDAFIERQRRIRGHYHPVADRGADGDDMLLADVTLTVDGSVVKEEAGVQLGVRPTRLDGIPLLNLADALRGAKLGDERTQTATIPDDYERADLRGKTATFKLVIREVKALHMLTIAQVAEQFGCASEPELRGVVREELEAERDRLVANAQKEQVCDYLLKHTSFDLPAGLSARQTDRAVARRVIELQQSGVPADEIERQIDQLRTSAKDEVATALKLEFILEKVATALKLRVSEEEINTEIARIARMYNQRFDRVRDDLYGRGLLGHLAEQIRLDKCVAQLLRSAKVEEIVASA